MFKKVFIFGFFILFPVFSQAQTIKKDTFSLKSIFSLGKLTGSIRQFSMFTDNHGDLTDYYALAVGAGLNYESKRWNNFQINFGGFFVNDLASSDFTKVDPTNKTLSRYDAGLFDILEVNNTLVSRVEKLNIRYYFKKSNLTFGKQSIKSPLVNPQDGRMTTSMLEGIYGEMNQFKNMHLEGGWLNRSSPRSTFEWFKIQNSIGTYPMGVNIDGKKANYLGNIESKGLLILGGNYAFSKKTRFSVWNYLIENVNNTSHFQLNQDFPIKNNKIQMAVQFFGQKALNDGGNADQSKTYMAKGTKSYVWSSMLGYVWKKNMVTANYSRITKAGRFQFPREWGRDPFFTFMQRERNEGLGDVHAFTTTFQKVIPAKRLTLDFGLGKYLLPDVKNFRLNKYGMPTYSQLNIGAKYALKKDFDGLEIQLLFVKKWNNGNIYNDEKYRINKVEMTNGNLVLNYNF